MPFQLPKLQTYPGIETPKPVDAMMKGQMQSQQIQRGQMENAIMGKKLEDYDEDRAYLKKSRGREDEEYNYKVLQRQAAKAKEFLPQINPDNYGDWVDWNVESVPEKMREAVRRAFKTPEEFRAMTPEQREAYKLEIAKNTDDLVATDLATQKSRAKMLEQQQKQQAAAIEKQKDRDAAMARAKLTSSKETSKEKTPLAIRKELARMEKMKLQITKTGGMNELIFSMIAQSNPEMADKIANNPENATAEIDAYMDSLRAELPKDPNAATKRLIFQDGKFIEK